MFRNLRYYRLESPWPESEEELSSSLASAGFEPCGPLTERSSGWVTVDSDSNQSFARRVNGADLIRMRSQSRILPHSAIREELEVRIADYRKRMQEAPTPREKRRMKAEARDELMPKAMLKSDRIWGYVDLKEKLIGIDTALESVAERFLRRLRAPFGDLSIRPLQFRQPASELLTSVFLGGAPRQFVLGRECRMQDAADAGSVVRWTDFDLAEKTIRNHVANGMRLTHLAIQYDNVMSFVLDENGIIRKLKFLGMDDDRDADNDPLARQDTEFALATGTLRMLLGDLKKLLGGYA
ncbi:MAG: recombination-associated protein RdgC [Halioglobus sp.]|nr:recombination-associated protein RdgC [Halioglobus sp.]